MSQIQEHNWISECINKVDEPIFDFKYQCLKCGIVENKPDSISLCNLYIFARYCGYCDENIPLDELKFHDIDEITNVLVCHLREYDLHEYNAHVKEEIK